MAQVINTNVASLAAGAYLNRSANALQTAQARLSSGVRINSAKDDATGLVSAVNFDKSIRTTNSSIRNMNDAISLAQTADGYMGQITENLLRISEIVQLTGQSSGNEETTALIAENTRLLGLFVDSAAVTGGPSAAYGVKPVITGTVASVAADLTNVNTARAKYGSDIAALTSAVSSAQISVVNLSASYSRVMDTDYAAESTAMTRNNILQQAGTAVLAQANQTPNSVLGLLR